jgi:exopolysaccharide production protein ExoQ
MSGGRKIVESLVLGGCAFLLSEALLPLILPSQDNPTEGSLAWQLVLGGCYLSAAIILIPYYRETLFVVRRNWSLASLVVLALVSCLWADLPSLVLRHSIAVFGMTLFGVALAVRLSLEEQLRLLSWVLRIIAVLSVLCVLFLPSAGMSNLPDQQGEWRGIFGYKNALGSTMALSVLVEWLLPADTLVSKLVSWLALLISAVLLVFSTSITPLVALLGGLLFIEIYKFVMLRLRLPLYVVVLGALLIVASGVTVLFVDSERAIGALGRSSDLTGRTEIWNMVLSYIPERPVLGYGYSGFWGGAAVESATVDRALGSMIMYSHNGYLEILLNLGAVGLLFTLAFLATGMKRAYDCSERNRSSVGLWPLAFLFFFLLHNIGECSILFQQLEWAVCVATVVGADVALLESAAEQEEELLFVPNETFT